MKGIFNSNPPKLKDYNTRDANIVLEDFRTVSSKELCLLPLACKLVTLLSLAAMLRVSELTTSVAGGEVNTCPFFSSQWDCNAGLLGKMKWVSKV